MKLLKSIRKSITYALLFSAFSINGILIEEQLRGAPIMIIEYMLKLDLVVTVVSLVTMIILLILDVTIPRALIWIFIISLVVVAITFLALKFYQSKYGVDD